MKYSKRFCLFVLKVFGALLLVVFFVLFWQESLKYLRQRRLRMIYDHLYPRRPRRPFGLPCDKEAIRRRKLWDKWFELQKQRFYQRQDELREEFSAQIEHQRNSTNYELKTKNF